MAYESVKNQIDAYIKANGVNLITGPVLNAVLTTMLDELGEGYAFQGVLNTTDTPSPAADIPQAWLASAGTYLGGSITVDEGELALIIHTSDGWSKETVYRGVQLSYEAIVAALGYTPADDADLAEKQDAIADISAIRSGAALGSTSVQPVDIENMVEAEPIGSIVPPVNPSEFATKEELSQLGQELYGGSAIVLDLTSYTEEIGTISGSKFYDTGGNYPNWRYILVAVAAYRGRTIHIVPHSTSDSTTYAFLKDDVLVHNNDANFATGYSTTVSTAVTFDVVVPADANYLFLRAENVATSRYYLPQSATILAQEGDLDKKVDKVVGKGLSTNDYTNEDKAKVATIPASFVVPSDLDNYVPKEQGIGNAGLLLKVGSDGKVTLGTGGGVGPDVTDCVRKEISRTLHLGENVLSGVVGTGTGWTENSGNYTHATGEASTLEFPLATDSGDAYVAIFSSSIAGNNEEAVLVSIGDGTPCDIYNGTLGPYYIGMVADGGHLKITADTNYAGTISGVELRKVVSEEDADISITLDSSKYKHYENVESGTMKANITGWWNVAMGANDALEANQNGSRNIAIGARAVHEMEGGTRNIGIGTFALARLKYGARNIAIGADSAWYMTGGYDNIALGKAAFGEIRGDNPQRNVAIGTSSLSINTSTNPEDNVAIGYRALSGGTNATQKVNCVAIGASAGLRNNTKCVAIGANSAFYINGQGNVAIGFDAMNYYNVDGQNNVCIGHLARLYPPSRPATIDNAIAIGYNANATKSNQVVIGNANNDEFVLGGKKLVFNQDGTISWTAV